MPDAGVPLPPDDALRVAALRSLGILDTEPEERFDRITRVAARMFGVPIALVSLVDADRQWAKSCVGLESAQTPRSASFCARAILGDTTLVVPDTEADPVFRANPQVTGPPRLRFYAGEPIRDTTGYKIGTLCIADTRPRTFSGEDAAVLGDLARWVEHELVSSELGEALRARGESERRLSAVMDTVADGVVSFGEDGVIESVNSAAEHIFGFPAGLLVGERVDKLLHRLHWGELERLLRDGPDSIVGELQLVMGRRSDYRPFPLELTVGRTRVGDRTLYVGVGRDVSDREAAEDALEHVRLQNELLLESAADGILGIDRDGRVTFVNPAAAEALDRYAYELIGEPIDVVLHVLDEGERVRLESSAIARTLVDGVTRRAERIMVRRDGTTFPVELTVAATRAERDVSGAVVTFRDISERYAVDRMKDEFLSVVGHELRTPLTSIRGSLGLLAGGVLGDVSPQAERMLEIAVNNTDRLARLVNDILDLERIESGRMELDLAPRSARELLDTTVQVVEATAAAKDVTLRVEAGDEAVLGDADRLAQALTNLAGNAVKFSPSGAEVVLRAQTAGDDVRFTVTDRGRGIPAEHLERIFERFEQIDASDARELGGTGLGLAIARSIVDAHGGRIWAESRPGEGATFVIALPRLRPAGAAAERPAVLVTGGTEEARSALSALLHRAGYRPATLLHPGPFAAVLVAGDPVGAGGTLAAMRARPETAGVPIVFVGGQDEEELLAALEQAVPALDPRHVLIVEDDLDLGRVLARLLERDGVQVTLARTGRQAIEAVAAVRPDLLLLDLVLPEGDGFSVVDHLRADPDLAAIPLVVYTAVDLASGDRARLRLGDTRIMTKSRSTPADVEQHVRRLLESLT